MKVTDLSRSWGAGDPPEARSGDHSLRIRLEDAARLAALAELYPDRAESDILNDIANAAVEDLAELNAISEKAEKAEKTEKTEKTDDVGSAGGG